MLGRAVGLYVGASLEVLAKNAVVRGAHHASYGGGSVGRSAARGLLLHVGQGCGPVARSGAVSVCQEGSRSKCWLERWVCC